jgi:hypothetical protein
MTMRNTARARAFRPQVTVPASPASAGGGASCTLPHAHATAWLSYCTVLAAASGTSITCRDPEIPRSAAPARSRPHAHGPAGNSGTVSSGPSRQARCAPGAPGCLPCRFPDPPRFRWPGAFRPGRSSAEGGIEELPEFLDAARQAASSCSRSSATSDVSSATCADSSRISASRGSSGSSDSVTARDHPRNQTLQAAGHGKTHIPQRNRDPAISYLTSHKTQANRRGRECLRSHLHEMPHSNWRWHESNAACMQQAST